MQISSPDNNVAITRPILVALAFILTGAWAFWQQAELFPL